MRNGSRLTLLLLTVLAVTIATSVTTPRARQQDPAGRGQPKKPTWDREGPDFEGQFPTVDYDAPETGDPDRRAERKEKNKRYDKWLLVSRVLNSRGDELVRDNNWQHRVVALPAGDSAAVALARARGIEAHLSNDKSGVYTEVTLCVEEVLKDDGSGRLSAGVIYADRPGALVKYPDGSQMLYRVFGMNMPRVGRRYVLFLTTPDASPNYRVLTGYELAPLGVKPLDVALHFDAYKEMDEHAFLKIVRDTIALSSQAQLNK
jgi:hypothetical protein